MERPMARKVLTFFTDDIDGSPADGSVQFGLDGTDYEIDLNAAHAEELRTLLEPYADAAREVTGVTWWAAARGRRLAASGHSTPEVRAWARAHGIEVKTRGRVPAGVTAKFLARTTYGDA
jgi:hypothetical protein